MHQLLFILQNAFYQVLKGWLAVLLLLPHVPLSPWPWLSVKKNSDFNLKQTRENKTDKQPSVRFSASWPKSPQCCYVHCNAPAPQELPGLSLLHLLLFTSDTSLLFLQSSLGASSMFSFAIFSVVCILLHREHLWIVRLHRGNMSMKACFVFSLMTGFEVMPSVLALQKEKTMELWNHHLT